MVCATPYNRVWLFILVAVAALVMVPFSASAQTYDVEVAVTYYYIDDSIVQVGSYYSQYYHPLVIILPAEVFFSNKVTFEDKRSGDELRKVKISIGVDDYVKKWKEKKYEGQYDWEGKPKAKKIYKEDDWEPNPDTPYISTIYELYHKVNDEWVRDDYAQVGEYAEVFKLTGPYAAGDPSSITLTDNLIYASVDTGIAPA